MLTRLHMSVMLCALTGVGPKVPKQSAIMGAMIGGLGGFMLAYQQSAGGTHNILTSDAPPQPQCWISHLADCGKSELP